LFLREPADDSPATTSQPMFTGLMAAFGVATVVFGLYVAPIQEWVAKSMDLLG